MKNYFEYQCTLKNVNELTKNELTHNYLFVRYVKKKKREEK